MTKHSFHLEDGLLVYAGMHFCIARKKFRTSGTGGGSPSKSMCVQFNTRCRMSQGTKGQVSSRKCILKTFYLTCACRCWSTVPNKCNEEKAFDGPSTSFHCTAFPLDSQTVYCLLPEWWV